MYQYYVGLVSKEYRAGKASVIMISIMESLKKDLFYWNFLRISHASSRVPSCSFFFLFTPSFLKSPAI